MFLPKCIFGPLNHCCNEVAVVCHYDSKGSLGRRAVVAVACLDEIDDSVTSQDGLLLRWSSIEYLR